ncbi:hypothetical protein [Lactiplantibacillus herbarum]|uniref:hypothetical protein n=1 Tax=Lactiplantibacillus herbarum TaxID=1670446 RepID=UPI00069DB8C3|nr:hypothetical protein [Lactiplantibacillus herbarum]
MELLDSKQAFYATTIFFESYYWASKDDDLGSILGTMNMWTDDDKLFDNAILEDWQLFFRSTGPEKQNLVESFNAVSQFANEYIPGVLDNSIVARRLTFRIRQLCELTVEERAQDPIWENWVAAVAWLQNPNVVAVEESPFLEAGEEPSYSERAFPIAKVMPPELPVVAIGPVGEHLTPDQSYSILRVFLKDYYALSNGDKDLKEALDKVEQRGEAFQHNWLDFYQEVAKDASVMDLFQVFCVVNQFMQDYLINNVLNTAFVRTLNQDIWHTVYMPVAFREQSVVWNKWKTAAAQAVTQPSLNTSVTPEMTDEVSHQAKLTMKPVSQYSLDRQVKIDQITLKQNRRIMLFFVDHYNEMIGGDEDLQLILQEFRDQMRTSEAHEKWRTWRAYFETVAGNQANVNLFQALWIAGEFLQHYIPDNFLYHTRFSRELVWNMQQTVIAADYKNEPTDIWENWIAAAEKVLEREISDPAFRIDNRISTASKPTGAENKRLKKKQSKKRAKGQLQKVKSAPTSIQSTPVNETTPLANEVIRKLPSWTKKRAGHKSKVHQEGDGIVVTDLKPVVDEVPAAIPVKAPFRHSVDQPKLKGEIRYEIDHGECIWVYDLQGDYIGTGLPDELSHDPVLNEMLEKMQNRYYDLFIDNEFEFRYCGFKTLQDAVDYNTDIDAVYQYMAEKFKGTYRVVNTNGEMGAEDVEQAHAKSVMPAKKVKSVWKDYFTAISYGDRLPVALNNFAGRHGYGAGLMSSTYFEGDFGEDNPMLLPQKLDDQHVLLMHGFDDYQIAYLDFETFCDYLTVSVKQLIRRDKRNPSNQKLLTLLKDVRRNLLYN